MTYFCCHFDTREHASEHCLLFPCTFEYILEQIHLLFYSFDVFRFNVCWCQLLVDVALWWSNLAKCSKEAS